MDNDNHKSIVQSTLDKIENRNNLNFSNEDEHSSAITSKNICCPHQILLNALSNHIIPVPVYLYGSKNSLSTSNKSDRHLKSSSNEQSKQLTASAKRRIRRKRNQMKRLETILNATAAATAVSILGNRSITESNLVSLDNNKFNPINTISNQTNKNLYKNSNNDSFYNCNASSFKIERSLRYVAMNNNEMI